MDSAMISIMLMSKKKSTSVQVKQLERLQKETQAPKYLNWCINFYDSLKYHNIGSILTVSNITLWQGSLIFQKDIPKTYSRSKQ